MNYNECKNEMLAILAEYNKKWNEFIDYLRDESEYKLEYLLKLSDEAREILENLTYVNARWFAYELSTSKTTSYIDCESNGQEISIKLTKKDEKIVEFDIYHDKKEIVEYEDGPEEEYVRHDIVHPDEVPLIRRYMDMFDIVTMCNASDAAWR